MINTGTVGSNQTPCTLFIKDYSSFFNRLEVFALTCGPYSEKKEKTILPKMSVTSKYVVSSFEFYSKLALRKES